MISSNMMAGLQRICSWLKNVVNPSGTSVGDMFVFKNKTDPRVERVFKILHFIVCYREGQFIKEQGYANDILLSRHCMYLTKDKKININSISLVFLFSQNECRFAL